MVPTPMMATFAGSTYSDPAIGNRPATAVGIGLAKLHAHAARAGEPALFVAEEFDRVGQHAELDAFGQRVMHFFKARRHLGLRAAIDQRCRARAKPPRRANCVHGRVAAADDDHVAVAAIVDRLVVLSWNYTRASG